MRSLNSIFDDVTIYTFFVILILWNSDTDDVPGEETTDGPCLLYGIVRETPLGVTLNICATPERRSHLYTTSTNSIEISIIAGNAEEGRSHFFMLEFQGSARYSYEVTLQVM